MVYSIGSVGTTSFFVQLHSVFATCWREWVSRANELSFRHITKLLLYESNGLLKTRSKLPPRKLFFHPCLSVQIYGRNLWNFVDWLSLGQGPIRMILVMIRMLWRHNNVLICFCLLLRNITQKVTNGYREILWPICLYIIKCTIQLHNVSTFNQQRTLIENSQPDGWPASFIEVVPS